MPQAGEDPGGGLSRPRKTPNSSSSTSEAKARGPASGSAGAKASDGGSSLPAGTRGASGASSSNTSDVNEEEDESDDEEGWDCEGVDEEDEQQHNGAEEALLLWQPDAALHQRALGHVQQLADEETTEEFWGRIVDSYSPPLVSAWSYESQANDAFDVDTLAEHIFTQIQQPGLKPSTLQVG